MSRLNPERLAGETVYEEGREFEIPTEGKAIS